MKTIKKFRVVSIVIILLLTSCSIEEEIAPTFIDAKIDNQRKFTTKNGQAYTNNGIISIYCDDKSSPTEDTYQSINIRLSGVKTTGTYAVDNNNSIYYQVHTSTFTSTYTTNYGCNNGRSRGFITVTSMSDKGVEGVIDVYSADGKGCSSSNIKYITGKFKGTF